MIQIQDKKDCCGCTACEQACPVRCIKMVLDEEGFYYPEIDKDLCVSCALCEQVCPILNANDRPTKKDATAYAAWYKDDQVRATSSSGGVFTALAEEVIKKGGQVVGAAFTDGCQSVDHVLCQSPDGLAKLRGSKYLQSRKGQIYQRVKELHLSGQVVLFSGTPCEVEGLKSYLRKPYENLICLDFICHGVPSPKLWEKYLHYRESKAESTTLRTSFRHKQYGWKKYSVLLAFSNHTEYSMPVDKDIYMQMFLQDLCLRLSCYDCKFKKRHRESDITLADFWGCENVVPEMDDDRGLSLVVLHSERGKHLLDHVSGKLMMASVDLDSAIKGNPSMITSSKKPEKRDAFMKDMNVVAMPELARRYLRRPSFLFKIKAMIKRFIPRRIMPFLKKLKGLR